MKAVYGSQCFDDVLAQDVDDYFDKPRVAPTMPDEAERLDLHAIEMECTYRMPSVLPRTASYAERLAERAANRADGLPDELC
jgi:hypothetical protein